MKFLKYLILLLLIVIIGTSIYIATLDGNYDIMRTRTIKAPVEVVFNEINDFRKWQNWGPWYELDSTIIASFPGLTSGVGASYTWTGKDGDGTMKTISLIPNKELIQQIDFSTGSTPEVYWNLNNAAKGADVTWGMRGENSFGEKLYWLTQGGIEKNMTPMYDRGLELLEQHLLKEMDKHSVDIVGVVDHGGGFYLYQTTSCKTAEISKKMGEMFPAVMKYMTENTIQASGKPFTLTHKWDEQNQTTIFSTCIPVKERILTSGDVLTGFLNPQKTFKAIYKGHYNFSYEAWEAVFEALAEQGYSEVTGMEPFEVYSISPKENANPAKWITEIYIPIE